jgi:serine/threonine protein kinase
VGVLSKLRALFGGSKTLPVANVGRRFDLMNRIGQGSMSKVWRAYDRDLGRVVCLKVLDKEKTAKFEARFAGMGKPMEGAIITALQHANVVTIFEYGYTTQREQYIVMEFIDGPGLNLLVDTRSPRLDGKRVHFLSQMADGLEHIHKQGYLHRDINPRNLMVNADDVTKYIDFGLAIPNKPIFLKPGNRTGDKDYLAPEVIKRLPTDRRVDLFALGVTAYEVFCGTLPWDKAQSVQTLMNHMNQPGKHPREHRRDLDDETAAFLVKAVERDPNRRFQSAAEFRTALEALPDPEKW